MADTDGAQHPGSAGPDLTGAGSGGPDPYDLARFVRAQRDSYDRALAEIKDGYKRTHWMWYVFPQVEGLGSSPTARRYAIRSLEEAEAYLRHQVLGPRLIECAEGGPGRSRQLRPRHLRLTG